MKTTRHVFVHQAPEGTEDYMKGEPEAFEALLKRLPGLLASYSPGNLYFSMGRFGGVLTIVDTSPIIGPVRCQARKASTK